MGIQSRSTGQYENTGVFWRIRSWIILFIFWGISLMSHNYPSGCIQLTHPYKPARSHSTGGFVHPHTRSPRSLAPVCSRGRTRTQPLRPRCRWSHCHWSCHISQRAHSTYLWQKLWTEEIGGIKHTWQFKQRWRDRKWAINLPSYLMAAPVEVNVPSVVNSTNRWRPVLSTPSLGKYSTS